MAGWTAPAVSRRQPRLVANEREALEEWLDFHRATLLSKCSGLAPAHLCERAVPPSNLSLLGLVRHMTEVERFWFRRHVAREEVGHLYCSPEQPEADFELLEEERAREDLARFEAEVALARAAAAAHDLDEQFPSRGHHPERVRDLRWIYLHMLEEYARHNGHADLLRQAIDGSTGT